MIRSERFFDPQAVSRLPAARKQGFVKLAEFLLAGAGNLRPFLFGATNAIYCVLKILGIFVIPPILTTWDFFFRPL